MRVHGRGPKEKLIRENLRAVKALYQDVTELQLRALRKLSRTLGLSLQSGELLMLNGRWYVTHSGLLRIAQRRRCQSITTELTESVCDPKQCRWVFQATVINADKKNATQ